MKFRNGFVSNSSSSSFILALDEEPKSPQDIINILWGQYEELPYGVVEMATQIFQDLKSIDQASVEKRLLNNGYMVCDPHYEYDSNYETYKKERKNNRKAFVDKYFDENKGKKFFYLHYSDDTVRGSQLEHDVPWWSTKEVVVISHH